MEVLTRQVRRASARLLLNRFVKAAAWCCFATLLIAAIVIAADKRWPLGAPAWTWVAGGAGLGLVFAIIYTWLTRPSQIDAAVELDRRFNLKERVSSALALDEAQRETAIGHALAEDAARRVSKIDVSEKFRLAVGRTAILPFVAAALAFGIATFVEPIQPKPVAAAVVTPKERQKIQKQTQILREQARAQQKKAEDLKLAETAELLTKIEQGAQKASEMPDTQKAMVKMNDLVKDVEQRRNQVGSSDRLRQQLDQLKDLKGKGPADKLADALKKGDMAQAAKELQKLRDKIAEGKMKPEEKQALANQMQQMEQKLRQMADKEKEMQKNLEQQIQRQKAAGNKAAAEELEKQLNELKQQAQQNQNMQKLAEQLGKAAQNLMDGEAQAAMEQLEGMKGELAQLEKQLAEMDMLEQALDQLQQCKGGMGKDKPGQGLGEGRGRGPRPEEKTDTKNYNTNVKQKLGQGKSIVVGEATGPNVKGDVEALIQTEFSSAQGENVDPLTDQNLPRNYREHTKKYFDKLREGK